MTNIRSALPSDATRISELYRQLVGHLAITVQPERIATIANDKNTGLFVCEYQGEVRGTALVSLCADVMFRTQPFAVVENVVIDTTTRYLGLGRALLRHIEEFYLANDCSKIMLLSAIEREEAHRFFERAGFMGSKKRGFVKYRSAFQTQS